MLKFRSSLEAAVIPTAKKYPVGDVLYKGVTYGIVILFVLTFFAILFELLKGSASAFSHTGFSFLVDNVWDPVQEKYGAIAFIWGTLYSSLIALLIAAPLGVGAGIFLSEYSPEWLRSPVKFLVEMLAAIPSVIYGLWALFFLVPLLRTDVQPFLIKYLGFLPFFKGTPIGVGMLAAGVTLSIMILPFIVSVTYEVLRTVPGDQREGSYALGSTKWETIQKVVLGYGKQGIFGGIFLAFGRAFGETMGVTMVIGNIPNISLSVIEMGNSMASVIANEFAEAASEVYLSHLVAIGLLLLLVALVTNGAARLLIWSVVRQK